MYIYKGDDPPLVTALGKKKKVSQNWYCGSPPMVTNREVDQSQHTETSSPGTLVS